MPHRLELDHGFARVRRGEALLNRDAVRAPEALGEVVAGQGIERAGADDRLGAGLDVAPDDHRAGATVGEGQGEGDGVGNEGGEAGTLGEVLDDGLRGGAGIEVDEVVRLDLRGGPGGKHVLLGGVEGALLGHGGLDGDEGGGRERRVNAGGAAVDLHEQAGALEAIEVAADRGLGGVEEVGELRDGDSVILRNHLDHALATFLGEHVGSFDRPGRAGVVFASLQCVLLHASAQV